MVKYYCDRCGREIENINHFFYVGLKDDDNEWDDKMVCLDCWEKALTWLRVSYDETDA